MPFAPNARSTWATPSGGVRPRDGLLHRDDGDDDACVQTVRGDKTRPAWVQSGVEMDQKTSRKTGEGDHSSRPDHIPNHVSGQKWPQIMQRSNLERVDLHNNQRKVAKVTPIP
jgi:hypothetical protein